MNLNFRYRHEIMGSIDFDCLWHPVQEHSSGTPAAGRSLHLCTVWSSDSIASIHINRIPSVRIYVEILGFPSVGYFVSVDRISCEGIDLDLTYPAIGIVEGLPGI